MAPERIPPAAEDVYARERVQYAWLVDPLAQLLEAWRLEGDRWLRLDTEA